MELSPSVPCNLRASCVFMHSCIMHSSTTRAPSVVSAICSPGGFFGWLLPDVFYFVLE